MKKRKLVNQMVSFIMAFVMIVGCLGTMPVMAQTASEATVAEEVTVEEETEEVVEDTTEETGSKIFDANAEGYATGLTEEYMEAFDAEVVAVESEVDTETITDSTLCMSVMSIADEDEELPESVDNTLPQGPNNRTYFPEIGNQGQVGSCLSWSRAYYIATYTMNRYYDREVTSANTMSPKYNYLMNYITYGTDTVFSNDIYDELTLLSINEVTTDNFSSVNEFFANPIDLKLTKEKQLETISNRVTFELMVKTGLTKQEIVDSIKGYLAAGEILAYESPSACWVTDTVSEGEYEGELIIEKELSTGGAGHALTLVGYDDNVVCDINDDGIITDNEKGAFKIANSWGKDWGNDGFVWLAYDSFENPSGEEYDGKRITRGNTRRVVYEENYVPDAYIVVTLEGADARGIEIGVDVGFDNSCTPVANAVIPQWTEKVNFKGEQGKCEGTFILDIAAGIESDDYDVFQAKDFESCIKDGDWNVYIRQPIDCDEFEIKDIKLVNNIGGETYGVKLDNGGMLTESTTTELRYGGGDIDFDNIVPTITNFDVTYDEATEVYTLACNATDDSTDLKYRFYVEDAYGNEAEFMPYQSTNVHKSYLWGVDIYQICVDVMDADGNVTTEKTRKVFEINPGLYVDKKECVEASTEVLLTADCNTQIGDIEYRFGIIPEYGTYSGEEIILGDGYSSENTCTINWIDVMGSAKEATGVYTLFVDARHTITGEVVRTQIKEYYVERIDIVASKAPNETTEGEEITFTDASDDSVIGEEYKFVFMEGTKETVIRDYSTEPTCTWTAEHSYYNPSIVVYKKVYTLHGEFIVSKSMSFSVNQAPSISGCSITSGEMELGESKQILISGSGGTGTLNRVVEVSYNGGAKTVYYSGVYKSDLYWTPDKAGTYTLWLSLEDENGIRDIREATINVIQPTYTSTVYYYNSSYSNAYIHYKVDNGSWTSVPGVKMESSNEQDGYTWKYVIDLGTETGATVCFNNGNGSWDSRNGANYTVGVGNYGIKNNAVSQLEEVSSIKFTVDKTSPVSVTDSATLSVTVNGSTDSYEYRFGTIFGGEEIILSNGYTDSSSCIMSMSNVVGNVNANAVGTHTLFVDVKNTTTGEVERATIDNYVVEGLKITSFTADKVSPQMTGTSIALSVTVENEATYSYNTYKFSAIKDGVESAISPSAEYSATWTPTEAGTYTLKYYIVDNYGQTATKTMEYVVRDASVTTTTVYYSNSSWSQAYIHYQIGNGSWTSVPGVKMESNTSGNGYTWKYVLDLGSASSAIVCFNNGNGSWDSKNGSNYTLGLGVFGIKNSTITELEEKLSVSVSADKSVGGTYNTTTFTAVATNGTAPYTYKIAVVAAGTTPTDSSYLTTSSDGTYLYTSYTAGSYTVYAKVTDANGDVAVTSMSYTIEGPKWSSFTATATDNKVGTAVTLKAEFVNCQYDPYNTYSFVVEKNGASTTYSAGSTGYYVWTPTEEGTYTITAKFTTFDGYSYTRSMTYEVSSDKANTVTVYYNSSWTNANIHYCIAGGSWTAVPGVAMTATSEKSGYTHKYVIDLGDATSVTVCFNNGSGTWDSQNGSNYTVYAGAYGVSGGTVYKLD